ncbi:DUF1631 domain-containing protein [Agaribacterium haliotis]|uniref:DUF1631 domain-containing protein n=1 Tax=Agaribacterium haliotis TaxID=2013869 RepID=UPI000BB59CA1|nr:DUF1631 domain-containing protein [Agaribacterium haliotis]
MITAQHKQLLNQIQRDSNDLLQRRLTELLLATDKMFKDLSLRASTDNEAKLYDETMRAIRAARATLIDEFCAMQTQNFDKMLNPKQDSYQSANTEEQLAVVQTEDLELELAQKNMADRSRLNYKTELYELEARLNACLPALKIAQHTNAFDPQQLSRAFAQACRKRLQLKTQPQLIFFKLFEKQVLQQLGQLYSEANQHFIDAGILPKVPRNQRSAESSRRSAEQVKASEFESFEQNSKATSDYSLGFQKFDSPFNQPQTTSSASNTGLHEQTLSSVNLEYSALSGLMASIRAARQTQLPGVLSLANYQVFSANPGKAMPAPELSEALAAHQLNVDQQLSHSSPKNVVPQLVSSILAQKDPQKPQALAQLDEDIINLIALFFDKILEDEELPLIVQSLICRLQIPVLKVALHDKRFLSDDQHPARQLINTITEAGASFDESKNLERDPLCQLMTKAVQHINRQFQLDQSVFIDANNEIRAALSAEREKSSTVEQRTKQSETGKAKLAAAKSFAQDAIYEKIKTLELPEKLLDFLSNTWLQVLIITYVRTGKDCHEWIEYEQVIADLCWLCQAHSDSKSQQRVQRLLPIVLKRIDTGLALVIDNAQARAESLQQLERCLSPSALETQARQSLNAEQKTKLGKSDPTQKRWNEMSAVERQQHRYEELSSQFFLKAKNMAVNTWLDYDDNERARTLRCKLIAKIDADNYVFSNRFGFKCLLKSRRQFAYDMQFKKARIISDTPTFERLMQRLLEQISSLGQQA